MPPLLLYWTSFKAMYAGLRTRLNPLVALKLLVMAVLSLPGIDKPVWQPAYFDLKSEAETRFFAGLFREFRMLITLFNRLKRLYGVEAADSITGKMAMPMSIPYLRQAFHPVEHLDSIFPVLQQLSDYLRAGIGADKAFEGQAFIAEDGTELRLFVTKCAHVQLLRTYGLRSFASKVCLADHVVFDTTLPEIVFSRQHTIGMGDAFCDHVIRLRQPDETRQDPAQYEDCHKIADGMQEVLYWENRIPAARLKDEGEEK
jgi:hypothetical protein